MKRNVFLSLITVALASLMLTGCNNSDDIGSSLVQDEAEVVIATDFAISAQSVQNSNIQSRTTTQVLGRFNAEGFGDFTSDFVTQFLPASTIDTEVVTRESLDSIKLNFYIANGSFVGDSIVPMGLEVYRLNKQLPSPIFSDFNPADYYNPADLLGSTVYACNAIAASDSIQELSYRRVAVDLPMSLAYELYDLYVTNPKAYQLPQTFAKYFPGVYVKNTFGAGRIVAIGSTLITMYYHTTETDDDGNITVTENEGNFYAVTPEIIVNNNISFTVSPEIKSRIAAGESIIVAPVGEDVEFEFPIKNVLDYYHANSGTLAVINALTMELPVEEISNDYGITPPTNLLLVLSKNKEQFFAKNEIPDSETSFYATYDSTNKKYTFSGLRSYLMKMLEKEDEITPEDYTFTLTPVVVTTQSNTSYYYTTSTYVSAVTPYIGTPVMARILPEDATITFTFSKQTLD